MYKLYIKAKEVITLKVNMTFNIEFKFKSNWSQNFELEILGHILSVISNNFFKQKKYVCACSSAVYVL